MPRLFCTRNSLRFLSALILASLLLLQPGIRGARAEAPRRLPAQANDPYDAQSTTGPVPPPSALRAESADLAAGPNARMVMGVPAYYWLDGCGPTSAGMILGYWDTHGYDWLIPGSAATETTAVDEAIASHLGTQNHWTDYALPMDDGGPAPLADRSESPAGDEHAPNSVADFFHTSWSAEGNEYGWSWFSRAAPALTGYFNLMKPAGYTATASNYYWSNGTFNWNMFKAEIDAGRPVLLLVDSDSNGVSDHFVAGIGYDDSGGVRQYAAYNTWDYDVHWYTFGPMKAGTPWGIYGATTLVITDSTGASHVNVSINGTTYGDYALTAGTSTRQDYAGVDSGPVVVTSNNGMPIVAAIRDLWSDSTHPTSSIQVMGLPASLLSTSYYFPAYNNVSLDDQLRFGNVGVSPTTVTVKIAGVVKGAYYLLPSASQRVAYAGVDSGPVVVSSSGGVPIIASIRDSWQTGGQWTSYSQLMGLPASQLSTSYYFPAYNNVSLDDQIRFGNVGTKPTTVTVTIAGVNRGTYYLLPSASQRVSYAGLDAGPVVVSSSGGVKIIASIRDSWWDGARWTSYSQLMGLPASQLSTIYHFPAYENVGQLDGQLRFGNVGTSPTWVTVTIGGVAKGTYYLLPSGSQRVSYAGLDSGPVRIESTGGVPIIASLRDSWWDGSVWTSYAQLMGLPNGQLSGSYYFPAYNNINLDDQLRIGMP